MFQSEGGLNLFANMILEFEQMVKACSQKGTDVAGKGDTGKIVWH